MYAFILRYMGGNLYDIMTISVRAFDNGEGRHTNIL